MKNGKRDRQMAQITMEICVCTKCMLYGGAELLKNTQTLQQLYGEIGEKIPFQIKTYIKHQRSEGEISPQVIVNRRLLRTGKEDEILKAVLERCWIEELSSPQKPHQRSIKYA